MVPLIFSLDTILLSALFFSKHANLLFFSFCSTICAFERIINPFNLFSVMLSKSDVVCSSLVLSLSILS